MALHIEPEQALAFRLDCHHLSRRLPAGCLLDAAGACGVQNTPPGSAGLSLHARLAGLKPEDLERAIITEKTLLQAWSLRGAPTVFPTAEAAVFTLGLAPEGEESLHGFVGGVQPALERIGISLTEVMALAAPALAETLDRRALTKDELGRAVGARVSERLDPGRRLAWELPSMYAPGQFLGESVVRFALPLLALQQLCCHAERQGNQALFRLTAQWLEVPLPAMAPSEARAELVRRYLHCCGPSTPTALAEWAGISPVQAGQAWNLVAGELEEISIDRRPAWLLRSDLERLASPAPAEGARFLPPHDPILQLRDRQTLVPDRLHHPEVWQAAGSPGVVLCRGRAVAAWRPHKTGRRLRLRLEPLLPAAALPLEEIEAEAQSLAPWRGCKVVEVELLSTSSL